MADLLKYLLTSLDTSHVSEVLTNFITDSGLKTTDSGFLESLKTVLIALREKGNLGESLVNKILHDICFPLLYNKEFASSDKTQHRRQCLHQAYDLIALCCSIYPDNFLVEVCERCIQAVGAFIEKNGKDLEIVGDALDISVALDLIGYLIKCEGQGKEGRLLTEELEEKIFQHILRLLPHTSETLCAKLTSVILPSFLEAKQKERIEALWNIVQQISETETGNADKNSSTFHQSYAILCGLADFFFDANATTDDGAPTLNICSHSTFWDIVQKGMVLMEPLTLKRAMFLLKKAVDAVNQRPQELVVERNGGGPVFLWHPGRKEEFMNVWQEFILLMEVLDEKQVHLIKPVLPRLAHVVAMTEKSSDGYPLLDMSWITTLYHRASHHENRFVCKWAALSILSTDLEKSPLLDPYRWKFLFGPLLGMLKEFSIYSRGEDAIRGDVPPVGQAIVQFFSKCVGVLPGGERQAFLCQLLEGIERQNFEEIPLVFVSQALAEVPPCPAWGSEELSSIKRLFSQLQTHNLHVRAALQCFLLKAVVNLTDVAKVGWTDVGSLLSSYRLEESLERTSPLWRKVGDWLWTIQRAETGLNLSDYLKVNIDNLLRDDGAKTPMSNVTVQALVRMLLIAADAHYVPTAGSAEDPNSASPFVKILQQLVRVIQEASTHVYASEKKVIKATMLLTMILENLCPDLKDGVQKVEPDEASERRKNLTPTPDPTVAAVLSIITPSFSEILNSLLRKLTGSFQEQCDLHNGGIYLKLAEKLFGVFAATLEGNPQLKQFYGFVKELTRSASATVTCEKLQQKNMSLEQWNSLVLAMKCLAWVCTSIRAQRDHFQGALIHSLAQTISKLNLQCEFIRPAAAPGDDVTGYDVAIATSVDWNGVVSDAIETQWTCVEFLLEEVLKSGTGPPDVSPKALLNKALEVLSVSPRKAALPVLRCIGFLIQRVLKEDENACVAAVEAVWRAFQNRQRREHKWFWEMLKETTAVLFSAPLLSLPENSPLTTNIRGYWQELMTLGEERPGIFNLVIGQCCELWSGVSIPGDKCRIISLSVHIDLVQEALLFGPQLKKALYIISDVIECLRNLDDAIITGALKYHLLRKDARARVDMINTLLTLDPRDADHVSFVRDLIRSLISRDADLSQDNSRSRLNSTCHRRKQRAWQAILVLLPRVLDTDPEGEFAADLLEGAFTALRFDNQISVRDLLEWTMVLTLGRYPALQPLLWQQMTYSPSKRAGSLVSLITVATLVGQYSFSDPRAQTSYFCSALAAILPWSLAPHVQTRMYAQVAVHKIWNFCRENRLEGVLGKHGILEPCVAFTSQNTQGFRQKCRLVQNFFFFDVDPFKDHSIQSLFYAVPCLAGVSDVEWISPDFFRQNTLGMRVWNTEHGAHGIPLYNCPDSRLAQMSCAPGLDLEARTGQQLTELMAGAVPDTKKDDVREGSMAPQGGDVQQKITPWKIIPPDGEIMAELQEQRLLTLQKSSSGNLVVVATLIDRAPNLGGLCRTCEIFGVRTLVLGNKHVLDDFQFKSLSVSAGKWMSIEEVRPAALKGYLEDMRRGGYTLIGVEQTANSENLTRYQFPHKSLLLLGHEKEGIPVELIQMLDECVEIPQVGVIRSLNVHVSGALLIWEYTRQRMLGKEAATVQEVCGDLNC